MGLVKRARKLATFIASASAVIFFMSPGKVMAEGHGSGTEESEKTSKSSHHHHHHHDHSASAEPKTLEEIERADELHHLEPGFEFELGVSAEGTYAKQKYFTSKDESLEYSEKYKLQGEHAFDPDYDLHGSYIFNFFGLDYLASEVAVGLGGGFKNFKDSPPVLSFELAPLIAVLRKDSKPYSAEVGGYSFDLGTLYVRTEFGAGFDLGKQNKNDHDDHDDSEEEHEEEHEEEDHEEEGHGGHEAHGHGAAGYFGGLSLTHTFDPLGPLAKWGKTLLSGYAVHAFAVNAVSNYEALAFTPYYNLNFGVSNDFGKHFISFSANNYVTTSVESKDDKFGDLFDYDHENYEVGQFFKLYYKYLPYELESDLRLYRVPFPIKGEGKYFTTHGFKVAYNLSLSL